MAKGRQSVLCDVVIEATIEGMPDLGSEGMRRVYWTGEEVRPARVRERPETPAPVS